MGRKGNRTLLAPPAPGSGEECGPLRHSPIFSRLTPEDQDALRSRMRTRHVAANETIVWCGDRGDCCYMVASGEVVVTAPNDDGEHIVLDRLREGAFFGEISLLDGGARTATVRATEPTELLTLEREEFQRYLLEHPDVAINILTMMGERQRASTHALRAMKNPNVAFEETRLSGWQRVSDVIAGIAASQWFTLLHIGWFSAWIGWNLLGVLGALPEPLAFDPFPFGLLTMVVSLEAIFLSIFVMVSQNRQAEKDRIRTDLDYRTNVKSQTQIAGLAEQLDRIEARLTDRSAPGDGTA